MTRPVESIVQGTASGVAPAACVAWRIAALTSQVVVCKFEYPKREGVASFRTAPWRAALFCCLCCLLSLHTPELAWGQYSSGGYSRPGGGLGYGYAASSRRMPISSSGGYSRRSYSGTGYSTGSSGDRALSRSMSSQALRDYQSAQRSAETYARRQPAYAGGFDMPAEASRRPSIWGGQPVARGPALPGSGPLTAVALWAALNSLSSPGSAAYFHDYQYDPGYVQWRREADREAADNPTLAAKLDQLDSQLAQMESQPRNPPFRCGPCAEVRSPVAASAWISGFSASGRDTAEVTVWTV